MSWTWLGLVSLGFLVFFIGLGFRRGFVREVAATFFVVLSLVAVWFINPYVKEFLRENTPLYETVREGCQSFIEPEQEQELQGAGEQQEFIDGLALPGFLKNLLEENNKAEVYRYLAVDNFVDYVTDYLAEAALNVVSFAVSYVLATLIIRMLTAALDILAKLPVIHGANKIAGGALGGCKFVLFVWIALLILSVFCNTEAGKKTTELIENDTFLRALSDRNILAKIFMDIF